MQRSVWEECACAKALGYEKVWHVWGRERRLECLEVGEGDQRARQRPDHKGLIMTCHGKKFEGLLNPVRSH